MADTTSHTIAATRQALQLARRLDAATLSGDWVTVGVLDRHVAALLRALDARSLTSADEHVALNQLLKAHQQARTRCAEAAEQMAGRLNEMRSNKDGWLAYAANSEWNGSPQ